MPRTPRAKRYDQRTNQQHPIFAFRTYSPEKKQELIAKIDRTVDLINRTNAGLQPRQTKHAVIIKALERGLDLLAAESKRSK